MKKKIAVIVALLILSMSFVTTASAGIFGGKWTTNPTYYISSSDPYYSTVNTAASRWNNAAIGNVSITRNSSVLSATVSVVANSYGDTGWNAQGQPGPDHASGTYTYATVRINRSYMDSYTTAKNTAIVTHEFGHVFGLAHNTFTSPKTLMYAGGSSVYYDDWGIGTPQTRDLQDMRSIYN